MKNLTPDNVRPGMKAALFRNVHPALKGRIVTISGVSLEKYYGDTDSEWIQVVIPLAKNERMNYGNSARSVDTWKSPNDIIILE